VRRDRDGGRRRLGGDAGDPLDGLVNLFDLGIVLAIAFLLAGLASTVDRQSGRLTPRQTTSAQQKAVPSPSKSPPVHGRGTPVGTVYRLSNGELVYTEKGGP
jgi:hypothetical protein